MTHLDVMVLTHPHPDHYLGLRAVAEAVTVGELWVNGQALASVEMTPLKAWIEELADRGTVVRTPAWLCHHPRRFGAAAVKVLGPCPSFDPLYSANDNSLVLRLSFGQRVALLTGDAEHHQERVLIDRWGRQALRADLLKVGHHGSRTSTTEGWLRAVRPSHALVSCGIRNRFGHPHRSTVDRLSRFAVPSWRTDRSGALSWWTNGRQQGLMTGRDIRDLTLRRTWSMVFRVNPPNADPQSASPVVAP